MKLRQTESVGFLRALLKFVVEFNKVMIPVAIGGIAVSIPFVMLLTWLTDRVASVIGEVAAAMVLLVFLLVTAPLLAALTVAVVGVAERTVPWDVWW